MASSALEAAIAREVTAIVAPLGLRRRGQIWTGPKRILRLMVSQAASSVGALVRSTVEFQRPNAAPSVPERVWFLLDDAERQAAVQQQMALLDRERHTGCSPEALMTDDDPNVETWFVAANADDVAAWAGLLRPVLLRTLDG